VTKPEGLDISDLEEAMEHMYPAEMIEFIEKSASVGGDIGDAFANLHDEAQKAMEKGAKAAAGLADGMTPDGFGFGGFGGFSMGGMGDWMPDVSKAGEGITSAISKISKTLCGDLMGDILVGSNPVTGVLLGIRKTYKLTKKAYNLANKAHKAMKKRAMAAAGKAIKEMQKNAIGARVQGNFRELKASISAMKTFPRQLKNDALGIRTTMKEMRMLINKNEINIVGRANKSAQKGKREGGLLTSMGLTKGKGAKKGGAKTASPTKGGEEEGGEPEEAEPEIINVPIIINVGAALKGFTP